MAFSNVVFEVAREAMNFWGVHPVVQKAVLHELQSSMGWVELEGVQASKAFRFQKMRTGGKDGPMIWNLVVGMMIVQRAPKWRPTDGHGRRHGGVCADGGVGGQRFPVVRITGLISCHVG